MKALVNGLDSVFIWLGQQLKQNLADYCDLETANSSTTLVTRDGSLVTLVRIEGVRSLISTSTFVKRVVEPLENSFSTYLEKKGHTMQFWFSYDPSKTKKFLSAMIAPSIETCKRLDLDLEQVFEEKLEELPKWSSYEECYLVLWTDQSILVKSEVKEAAKKQHKSKTKVIAPLENAQDPYAANSLLIDRHNTFVSSTVDELAKCDIIVKPLSVYEACKMVRSSIDDDFTPSTWQPFLPSDPIKPHVRKQFSRAQQWDIVWPKLSWQVCPRDAKVVEDKYVQIGDKIYAPVYIDLMPKEVRQFSELFGNLLNKKMPWRISCNLSGDGMSAVQIKGLFASILSFTSQDNKLLSEGVKALQYAKENSKSIIQIRIALCTWAHISEKDDLSRRLSELSSAVQNWGSCLVSDITGDPVAGFISTALGANKNSIATTSAAPLDECIFMLPLSRPSSPWKTGGVVFRSPNGKLLPYQPGSSLQATWINLIFAGPGSGKSVLMNALNLALTTKEGNRTIPKIGIIDIGPSSSGLISLIQEALPSHKKHLARHIRLRMTEEYCVNVFDTQLGCRFPTAEEASFLKNFVTLLVTDPAKTEAESGMTGLVSAIIDDVYKATSELGNPKKYETRVSQVVDEVLKKVDLELDSKTTWWEVVDALSVAGYYYEASIAQRYAVPILADTTEIAQSSKIKMLYDETKTSSTGEFLIKAFIRGISEALNLYKILSKPTVFDTSNSRVTAIDLDEVAKSGGSIADRQTGVMYMLARYLLAKDYKIIAETVSEMPYPAQFECPKSVPVQVYKKYHMQRVMEMREEVKRLCFDEFHRTAKSPMVRDQVLVDMREGRKWNMDIILASQSINDFDERMREFTTTVFIMNGGNEETVNNICNVFGVDDPAERNVLSNGSVHPPRRGGGTFLAKFYTTQGRYTQLLSATLGPMELWSFSTTSEETNIRDRMYKKLGPKEARKVLAAIYPNPADAREVVSNKQMNMKNVGMYTEDESNVYDQMCKEIIEKYNTLYRRNH